jgi:peptidoglycan/xylan/chitin deacetylase (PgdA/CDA1 family)
MLVTVGDQEFSPELKQKLTEWTNAGGAWLSIGGVCGMNDLLGVQYAPSSYANWGPGAVVFGEGYLLARQKHPAVAHLRRSLHFFGGLAMLPNAGTTGAYVIAGSVDAHQQNPGPHVLFEHNPGSGRTMTLAVDVTGTIVRIQQGIGITRDGISAPDGTAPVTDAVLKSGDGATLDWIFDRQPVKGVFGLNMFQEPIADLWRDLVLRCIFHLATVQKIPLPVLWLYPRRLPCIAHLSHDSDNNEPEKAKLLLDVLKQTQINSTWCIILPGYDAALTNEIKQAGHELATHYDAMTMTPGLNWGEDDFDAQHRALTEQFGETPVTNKNHFLRWEGDVEFFDWCAKRKIELDQSKGPSKTGEAGFNFGSCHPYFPVRFNGESIDVLELATLTQDLVVFAPPLILQHLMDGTQRVHGIMHLLFHPAHMHRPEVREACANAINTAKAAGMEWWTSRQINTWERARRKVKWSNYSAAGGSASVTIATKSELRDATILWLGSKNGDAKMHAWGFEFTAATQSLAAGASTSIRCDLEGK